MQIRLMLFKNTAEIGNDSSLARNYNFTCEITKLLWQRVLHLSAKMASRLRTLRMKMFCDRTPAILEIFIKGTIGNL